MFPIEWKLYLGGFLMLAGAIAALLTILYKDTLEEQLMSIILMCGAIIILGAIFISQYYSSISRRRSRYF